MESTFNNVSSECSNNTTNTSVYYSVQDGGIKATFYVLYIVVFTLGIIGNALVCHVVCRNKAMQTVTNIFIMNLALSDILLCTLAVPFTPLYSFMGRWIFGSLICHLVPYAQGTSIYISTLTLTSIAIDRYFVILYPLRPRMQLATSIAIIISIWIMSMLATLPYGIYMDVKPYQGVYEVCEENWPNGRYTQRIFGALTTILQFILPFCIIAFCYVCVSLRLNNRAKMRRNGTSIRREEIDRERKTRTNRMLIAMVTIFVVSWLPLNVINIATDFYEPSICWPYFHIYFLISHCLAMSSTCYNPFLYAWLNENFRKEFKLVLPCFLHTKRRHRVVMGRRLTERTINGTDTIQETLLHSVVNGSDSPVRCLEPRDPLVQTQRFQIIKEESISMTGLSYALQNGGTVN